MTGFKFKKQDPLRWQDRLRRQDEKEDDERIACLESHQGWVKASYMITR